MGTKGILIVCIIFIIMNNISRATKTNGWQDERSNFELNSLIPEVLAGP